MPGRPWFRSCGVRPISQEASLATSFHRVGDTLWHLLDDEKGSIYRVGVYRGILDGRGRALDRVVSACRPSAGMDCSACARR
jgi:hypothetical protein